MPVVLMKREARPSSRLILERLDTYSESQHFLTDGRGIDLVTGEDRSDLRQARRPAVRRLLPPAG